jgi:hypothetical protein
VVKIPAQTSERQANYHLCPVWIQIVVCF